MGCETRGVEFQPSVGSFFSRFPLRLEPRVLNLEETCGRLREGERERKVNDRLTLVVGEREDTGVNLRLTFCEGGRRREDEGR